MNAFAKPNLAVDQIPSASAADKDKVLTIDANGVPVWAENQGGGGGGGGGATIVHGVYDETTDTTTLDMTAGDILDAAQTGVVIVVQNEGDSFRVGEPVAAKRMPRGFTFQTVSGVKFKATTADDYPREYGDD